MPLNNSGVSQVTSANADIAVANGSSAPQLTLNSGTSNNQIVKLDSSARLPAIDGSLLTNLSATSTDISYLNQQQLIQNIDILRCLANASLSISDYSTMFCDLLSDSSGYSNTIDTGAATTAAYDNSGKVYKNTVVTSGSVEENTTTNTEDDLIYNDDGHRFGQTFTHSSSATVNKIDLYVKRLGNPSTLTAAIYAVDTNHKPTGSSLMSGTYPCSSVGTSAFEWIEIVLSSPFTLSANTEYAIVCTISGSNGDNGLFWRYNSTNVYSGGIALRGYNNWDWDWSMRDRGFKVIGDLTVIANKIVQTNTITVSNNITAFQLYCKKAVAGSGSVQFKISFDNGSTWSDAKELNTYYTNSTTGTSVKVQLLVNGSGSGNTSQIENYSLMVWY